MAADHINNNSLSFIQVPHHGSRRNIGPAVLNKLVGNIVSEGGRSGVCAFISCAPDSDKHPHQAVINAFTRRGAKVVATEGTNKRHSSNAPPEMAGLQSPHAHTQGVIRLKNNSLSCLRAAYY